jgi:hypothetical protein
MQFAHEARHVTLSTDAARQGVTGHNVRYVLAWGLFGIVSAYLAIGILAGLGYFGGTTP